MKKIIFITAIVCLLLGMMTGARAAVGTDREGTPVALPASIERIASFGPSNTEILTALGLADKLVAVDAYSANIEGIPADLQLFDMMTPDAEKILQLNPDILFVTGMSKADGDDPYKPIKDAGICVIYIPSSVSIEDITEDIRYIASVVGENEKGEEIVGQMEAAVTAVKAVGDTVVEKKSVYFEISAAPYMYSFGSGVFLNEMIKLVGATNVLASQNAWISVTDEAVLAANPDVILTSVNYIDNPVEEIMARSSWDALTAVKNNQVYYIDTDASNRPSQNIIKALREIAVAIYPELYQELEVQKAGE